MIASGHAKATDRASGRMETAAACKVSQTRLSASPQTSGECTQETLNLPGVPQRIARRRALRLFADKNSDAALFKNAEGVFVGAIVSNINRANPA